MKLPGRASARSGSRLGRETAKFQSRSWAPPTRSMLRWRPVYFFSKRRVRRASGAVRRRTVAVDTTAANDRTSDETRHSATALPNERVAGGRASTGKRVIGPTALVHPVVRTSRVVRHDGGMTLTTSRRSAVALRAVVDRAATEAVVDRAVGVHHTVGVAGASGKSVACPSRGRPRRGGDPTDHRRWPAERSAVVTTSRRGLRDR